MKEQLQDETVMIQARIHHGRIEVQDPIPASWEGQLVKILPLTPEDALPDLERRLLSLHHMGPMDLDADERELIGHELERLNQASKQPTGNSPSR